MQTVNTVFPNEELFQRIYEEWMFYHAYQCGYEAAIKALKKGGKEV